MAHHAAHFLTHLGAAFAAAELFDHLSHLLKLGQQPVHILHLHTAAGGDTPLSGRIDDLRLGALLHGHRVDNGAEAVKRALVNVLVLNLGADTGQHLNGVTQGAHALDLVELIQKIVQIKIDPDKIGEVIGQRGKTINTIIEETGVKIDIDDDGNVSVCGVEQESMDKAMNMIKMIVEPLVVGDDYKGKVVKILDCGAIVSLAPNKDGLIHISKLSDKRVAKVEDVVNVGDDVVVKVIKIDERAGRISSA